MIYLITAQNLSVDISIRAGESGRQPYSAKTFFTRYAHRILFGSDLAPDLDEYRVIYRFLKRNDEYIIYSTGEIP